MISPEVVQRALASIKRRADYEYFFTQLSVPDWIIPLKEAGLFSAPPKPEPEGKYITFPTWPESEYLVRMTEQMPEAVAQVALEIHDTQNIRVNDDLNKIALSLPPQLAVRFAAKAKRWAASQYTPIFPEKLGELVAHLARGGYGNEALDLARVLLAVLPDPRKEQITRGDGEFRFAPRPRARLDQWDYRIILNKHIPVLVEATLDRGLQLLCSLLGDAVRLSRSGADDQPPEDYSYIWRRAIEHNGGIDDTKNALVTAVRDAAEQIARADREKLPEFVGILTSERWLVFHRIAMHLLRLFADDAPDLVAEWLTSKSNFDVVDLTHEYFLLARERFSYLKSNQQRIILDWIDAGPDLDSWKDAQERWFGERPSDEAAEQYAKRWRLRHLTSFRHALPDDWKRKYEEWEREVGQPEYPDYVNPPSTMSFGFESPKSDEDLRSMSLDGLMSFLGQWRPASENPVGPTYEGLAQKLEGIVASKPESFAVEATRFKSLDPTYVRALISGLREAVREKRTFQWAAVVDLCAWVVSKPFEEREAESSQFERDPDWAATRGAISHLLTEGLKHESEGSQVPFELREAVWLVIEKLTDDPNPTPEHETRYGGSNMDSLTLSLNTNRGEAMHCVVHYALWCQRHLRTSERDASARYVDFNDMPEVRRVLDKHLDPEDDPSQAIRAVYGMWLPWLIQLDETWVVRHLSRIFPNEEQHRALRDAAWETYIVFNQPWNNVFDILCPEYGRAVERIGTRSDERSRSDPDQQLAEHLMVLFGRGRLRLDGPDGILAKFYETAPDDLRGHAVSFIGSSFIETEEPLPVEVLERFQALWTARLHEAESARPTVAYKGEVAAVGLWFASAKLDDVWAITQLRSALKFSGSVNGFDMVLERLAHLAPEMPLACVESLGLMLEGDNDRWHRYAWHEQTRTILKAAINSQDSAASESAVALIHRLGARDPAYNYLRDLLPSPQ